jgi:hypothetical protein
MLRLAIAALLGTSIHAVAAEQSPWFGSAEMLAFQIELPLLESGQQDSVPKGKVLLDCPEGNCPEPRKLAIDAQDLAAAP